MIAQLDKKPWGNGTLGEGSLQHAVVRSRGTQRIIVHTYLLFSITNPSFICLRVVQLKELLQNVGNFNTTALVRRPPVPMPLPSSVLAFRNFSNVRLSNNDMLC